MKLTPILLIFAAGAVTALFAGSIGNASVQTSAGLPLPDFCQQSASGASISIGCDSFRAQLDVAHAGAEVAVSFGTLSMVAQAGASGGVADASASASYDEFPSPCGNRSWQIPKGGQDLR